MALVEGYKPEFDRDYQYGKQGELFVDNLLDAIAKQERSLEIKRKRYVDDSYFVEIEQNAFRRGVWKPSGIATTDADWWAYVVGDGAWIAFWPTGLLKHAIQVVKAQNYQLKDGGDDGDNPTHGYLIPGGILRQLAIRAAKGAA